MCLLVFHSLVFVFVVVCMFLHNNWLFFFYFLFVFFLSLFFFFKQKTAYEMRISDWSSDVCSSDLDRLPVDIARLVRSEERRDPADLRGLAAAPERIEAADPILLAVLAGVFVGASGHARLDQPGADRVDADIGARKLLRGGLDEADHPRLRRRIGRSTRARAQARHARGAHDRPLAALDDPRRGVLDREDRADQVDAQNLRPQLGRAPAQRSEESRSTRLNSSH